MVKNNNLTDFLRDLADRYRLILGTSASYNPQSFADMLGNVVQIGTTLSNVSYTVTNRSSPYGFQLQPSGYYESNNKGVQNSYAVCRVNFTATAAPAAFLLACINYGEYAFDFGIIGKPGVTLNLDCNNSNPSTDLIRAFTGNGVYNTSSVQYIAFSSPQTSGFFDVKFRKDGSQNYYNDSFQFKLIGANRTG